MVTRLRAATGLGAGGALGAAGLVVVATLVLVGQPLYANDSWIHLALGEAFWNEGPWLSADPHLFAAPGPPAPSSWLGAVLLNRVQHVAGFPGLRVLHVLLVAGILLEAGWIARSAGGARSASALGVAVSLVGFVALSTFRLVQLRPELLMILWVFALFLVLIRPREGPSAGAILFAALGTILAANVHAGFVLGPILIAGTAVALGALACVSRSARAPKSTGRIQCLGLAALVMTAAGLLNPQGLAAYTAYGTAGEATLALGAVVDEWSPTNLFALPVPLLPPTWAAWIVVWLATAGTVFALGETLWRAFRGSELEFGAEAGAFDAGPDASDGEALEAVDPALIAWAVAGLLASFVAVRFLWLGLFGVVLCLRLGERAMTDSTRSVGWGVALGFSAAVLAALHFTVGDWPLVSRALRRDPGRYAENYRPEKFFGHAMEFLRTSEVEGRIYNDYPLGGFMSFWFAGRLEMASSGTMNVKRGAMEDFLALEARDPGPDGDAFRTRLADHDFDLFLATGLPLPASAARRQPSTLRHLEGEPNWVLAFRSLRSAVFVRRPEPAPQSEAERARAARRAGNLARIAAYYRAAGIEFDPERGLDVALLLRASVDWAIAHGVVPEDYSDLLAAAGRERTRGFGPAGDRLAELHAVLGDYVGALRHDRPAWGAAPSLDPRAGTRTVWCLLQLRRFEAASRAAARVDRALGARPGEGWGPLVRFLASAPEPIREARLRTLPLLDRPRAQAVQQGLRRPTAWSRLARP